MGADEYKVRAGDTLSRIAGKTQRPGVSLDQMLVSLYKANPDAFLGSNMNRLKSGVVLSVPSSEDAKAVTQAEARQLIQAQSADFSAYRQRLAGAVPAAKDSGPARQATGTVQTEVQDRKQAAAAAPDKLTLSKGAAAGKASTEEKIAKGAEKKDTATRVAELSKNVAELKKLGDEAAKAKAASAAAPAAAPAPAPASAPVSVAVPAKPPVPAPEPAHRLRPAQHRRPRRWWPPRPPRWQHPRPLRRRLRPRPPCPPWWPHRLLRRLPRHPWSPLRLRPRSRRRPSLPRPSLPLPPCRPKSPASSVRCSTTTRLRSPSVAA